MPIKTDKQYMLEQRLKALLQQRRAVEGERAYVTADDIHQLLRRDKNYKARGGRYIASAGIGNVFRRAGWVLVGFVNSGRKEARGRSVGAYRFQA